MPAKPFKWSKVWIVQAEKGECKKDEVIIVHSSQGPKKVKVTDIVTRTTRSGTEYDVLFTEDVDE